jgi:hypothetical protein
VGHIRVEALFKKLEVGFQKELAEGNKRTYTDLVGALRPEIGCIVTYSFHVWWLLSSYVLFVELVELAGS